MSGSLRSANCRHLKKDFLLLLTAVFIGYRSAKQIKPMAAHRVDQQSKVKKERKKMDLGKE